MKKIRPTRLAVSRETVKLLSTAQLTRAAGGIESTPMEQCPTKIAQVLPKLPTG